MLVHKESNSLILKLRDPGRVTTHIPRARVVQHQGMPLTQVYFGLDEARVLRNLGINAPSPIRYFYTFPIRPPFKPFDHQVTTAEFFTLNPRCICLNDMGTGKTLSALWAADYLMERRIIQKTIVVCPKSTMTLAWEDEASTNMLGKRVVAVLSGSKERRLKQLARTDVDIYVINHDGLKVVANELAKRKDINLWIIDEAAKFRNATSQRHQLLARLVPPTSWRWLLTGTPCPQDPTDAWGLAKLMHGQRVNPQYFTQFRNQTMLQLTQYKWVPKPDAYDKAYAILQPGIRFKKEHCIDLPPVMFQTRMSSLSPDQVAAYKAMITTLVANVKGVDISAANAAVKMFKLLQVCVGSIYDEFGNGYDIDSSDRLNTLEEIVEEAGHKVIVFVPFTHALDKVVAHLRKRWTVEKVDGRTSDGLRTRIFHDFQQGENPRIIVAHPETTAHGLTLTKADTTIWYAPITSLETFEQANNRMNRPGQKNKMTIAMIAATMLEQNLYQALKSKQDVQNSVLSLFKAELGID
jgi:SNF2 family DNA or RNA helicase